MATVSNAHELAPRRARHMAGQLLDWYGINARRLPWRARGRRRPDPYRVWLSEIMLQQTTVTAVIPYYVAFLKRWPNVQALAAASLDDILHAWQGLGYYARARNLHACARQVVAEHFGRFPESEAALRDLPGVGSYTAAAIAAIVFDEPATVVDGNVIRVISRLFAIETPLPAGRDEIAAAAAVLAPTERPGDYAQAIMDLGATVCTPRAPECPACPWRRVCRGRAQGRAHDLPRRDAKSARPTRYAVAFWAERSDGTVLLRRRPPSGLLGGMMEVPSTPWRATPWRPGGASKHQPLSAVWRPLPGVVEHTFTHFHLKMTVVRARPGRRNAGGAAVWCAPADFAGQALPSVMKKIACHVLSARAALR
jgi:A/G-specific adenine glycosylase